MTRSPLHNLVLFLIGLAVSGTIVAGVHYLALDIPAQQANPAPLNYNPHDPAACARCMALCALHPWDSSCPNNCMRCDCSRWECSDR